MGCRRIPLRRGKVIVRSLQLVVLSQSKFNWCHSSPLKRVGMTMTWIGTKRNALSIRIDNKGGHGLFALFRSGSGQSFQLFLVDLHFAGFLHLVAQIFHEQREKLIFLSLLKRVANLVLLGSKVLVRGCLLLQHRQNNARVSCIDRATDFARLERERNCRGSCRPRREPSFAAEGLISGECCARGPAVRSTFYRSIRCLRGRAGDSGLRHGEVFAFGAVDEGVAA